MAIAGDNRHLRQVYIPHKARIKHVSVTARMRLILPYPELPGDATLPAGRGCVSVEMPQFGEILRFNTTIESFATVILPCRAIIMKCGKQCGEGLLSPGQWESRAINSKVRLGTRVVMMIFDT